MQDIFKEIERVYKKCIELLEEAPSKVSQTIRVLLQKLQKLIQSGPDLAEKALPIFYNIYECIIKQQYTEAVGGLALLLILLAIESRDK